MNKDERPSWIWIPFSHDEKTRSDALKLCGYDPEKYEIQPVTNYVVPKEGKNATSEPANLT